MLSQSWTPFDRSAFPGNVEAIAYGYDVLGNLVSQERQWRRYDVGRGYANVLLGTDTVDYLGASKETYRYDGLQRLLSVDRATGAGTALGLPYGPTTSIGYQYDAVGNLRSESNFADSYTYGTAATPGSVGTGGTPIQGGLRRREPADEDRSSRSVAVRQQLWRSCGLRLRPGQRALSAYRKFRARHPLPCR
jgi:hypothetical protein